MQNNRDAVFIEDDEVGSMFGAALHSVDMNFDSFVELLVGAPAQSNTIEGYEQGAVHFYIGGGKVYQNFVLANNYFTILTSFDST